MQRFVTNVRCPTEGAYKQRCQFFENFEKRRVGDTSSAQRGNRRGSVFSAQGKFQEFDCRFVCSTASFCFPITFYNLHLVLNLAFNHRPKLRKGRKCSRSFLFCFVGRHCWCRRNRLALNSIWPLAFVGFSRHLHCELVSVSL